MRDLKGGIVASAIIPLPRLLLWASVIGTGSAPVSCDTSENGLYSGHHVTGVTGELITASRTWGPRLAKKLECGECGSL